MIAPFKVLLVLLDSALSRFVGDVVAQAGGVAFHTTRARLALELLQDNPDVQLVVVQEDLPEMEELELVRALRERPHLESLPVLVLGNGRLPAAASELVGAEVPLLFLPRALPASELRRELRHALGLPSAPFLRRSSAASGSFPIRESDTQAPASATTFPESEVPTRPDVRVKSS